jgi:hypothetical protein
MQGFVPSYGGVEQRLRSIELHLRATPVGAGGEVKAASVSVAVTGGASFQSLDSLDDVSLSVPAAGDALIYDGAFWTNSTAYITTAPTSATRNTITPTGDYCPLTLKGVSSMTDVMFQCKNSGNNVIFAVDPSGQTSLIYRNAGTTDAPGAFRFQHSTSGVPAAGFGVNLQYYADDAGNTARNIADVQAIITDPTAGAVSSYLAFSAYQSGTARERIRLHGDGRGGVTANSGTALATGVLWNLSKALAAAPTIKTYLQVLGVADTALTASTEAPDVNFNLGRTVQWSTGALTDQRFVKFLAPTIAFVGASTVTRAATVYIDNAPQAGTNATLTNSYALWVDAGIVRCDGNGTYVFELPADATDPTTGGGAATGRIPCFIGGALRYIPYY